MKEVKKSPAGQVRFYLRGLAGDFFFEISSLSKPVSEIYRWRAEELCYAMVQEPRAYCQDS
jgi:hypothetical protein